MKKILVTTDFSTHSKAGVRFAIQLASQTGAELIFIHCFQALIPTTIHRERIDNALVEQTQKFRSKLEKFVADIYKSMKVTPGAHSFVAVEELNPTTGILDYAHQHQIDYVCISTRGAGTLRKIIGTNTSTIVVKSAVPVLVVPHNWRRQPIKKMLYASDLENLDKEMAIVTAFAQAAGIKSDLAHFYYPSEIKLDPVVLAEMWQKKYPQVGRVYLERFNVGDGFAHQLGNLIDQAKPSLVVFFTHTNQTWFDKLFSTSRSEAFTFATNVPMLVYRKN
ncbi:MAG: universal stress protein [Saprospiraceae bacterium]|nr:universal stress protein [Saprospiraceae bacterium]